MPAFAAAVPCGCGAVVAVRCLRCPARGRSGAAVRFSGRPPVGLGRLLGRGWRGRGSGAAARR
eukprot:8787764-Alexandrium_andersonii.AAC.1